MAAMNLRSWLLPAVLLAALYFTRNVLPPFVIAAVLAYAFSPIVDELVRRVRIPRRAAAVLVYLLVVGSVVAVVWALETQASRQFRALGRAWPEVIATFFQQALGREGFFFLGTRVDPQGFATQTIDLINEAFGKPGDALRVAEIVIETALRTVLTLVALFYFLMDGPRIRQYLLHFVPADRRVRVDEVLERSHVVLGRYLRGQLVLVLLMSTATFVMLQFAFQMPYAIPLAVMTGVLEVIPLLGPVAAGAIAALVAFSHGGGTLAVYVVVGYTLLRQIEDQLVMPVVVGRAVHLHPLMTMFAVVAGGAVAGVLGIILAVPFAAVLKVAVDAWIEEASPAEALVTHLTNE